MGLISFLSSIDNKRSLKRLNKEAEEIIALKPSFEKLSDEELANKTQEFKDRLKNGEKAESLRKEAYAVVREASRRVLNMEHYKVQIMGGIALFDGRITEMKTGEGKTLVETLPAYLAALSGKGVHIVTVNDYLARRDAEWMGKIFKFLKLTVGVISPLMPDDERKKAYNCDITYGTNNEFGFDYLRDNLKVSLDGKVQRELNFAIVDEVDSILIDEARTPLIISGGSDKPSENYKKADLFAKRLKEDDFDLDFKEKTVVLTEIGAEKAEKYFGVSDISDISNKELLHYIQQALKANYIFKKDVDYIVENGEVLIVDEFTGRIMIGRRYSEGLHQALEAKENVAIRSENKTHATITFQNYFRMYRRLSGMTGTAKTEEEEFKTIYNLDVITIPTNKPLQRKDLDDIVYPTERGKIRAIIAKVKENYQKGQPTLIGTATVEKSELYSYFLKKEGVPHNVLNAKNHSKEADIVAQAGRFKAITIATNMAGRGTDIMLGGNPEFMAKDRLIADGVESELIEKALSFGTLSEEEKEVRAKYEEYLAKFKTITDEEKEKVLSVGGLFILGSERHESRRIDNQLRGRAGRQGDKGVSVFYISLEDDLAKRFGGESLQGVYEMLKVDEDTPISAKMLSGRIEYAQKVIEGRNFAARKSVLEYDNVMNVQRAVMYEERDKVLRGEDVHDEIISMIPEFVESVLYEIIDKDKDVENRDIAKLNKVIEQKLLTEESNFINEENVKLPFNDLLSILSKETLKQYEEKTEEYTQKGIPFAMVERFVLLKTVDEKWIDQIDQMDVLRRGIALRAYANVDPIVAYKNEAYDMFEDMTARIREDTAAILLKAHFNVAPKREETKTYRSGGSDDGAKAQPIKKAKEVGRNDPCPCGSGRKYKNCCGKNKE